MHTPARPVPERSVAHASTWERLDGLLLRGLASRLDGAPLRYALGRITFLPQTGRPVATLRFRDRWALLGLLLGPETHFGDAYAEGRIEIEGDLVAALAAAYRALETRHPPGAHPRGQSLVGHGRRRAWWNAHRHYDLGNDFYALWLDEQLLYTCAYFDPPDVDLEAAQRAKLELVCRKLGLQPGESVVEAGCGWGALALHMARRHGVRVRAYNVSHEQIEYARERAASEGLGSRVEFLEQDYRDIREPCDVFVSIGMLEHVGRDGFPALGRVIRRCLDPARGRGLLHFIGRDRPRPLNSWIQRRIFPGAYPPSPGEVFSQVLEPAGQSVVDVENLRPHYERTLRHWRERYEKALAEGRVGHDERFRRGWRLYLAGSEAAFRVGSLQLFQILFVPSGKRRLPWSRQPLYAGSGLPWSGPTS